MSKLKLELDNAPQGIGSKQLFDNKEHMNEILEAWQESGKMKNVSVKGSALSFETDQPTVNGKTKGSGLIKEVKDDFVFEEEKPE